jgi:hypothetical protein
MKFIAAIFRALVLFGIFALAILLFIWPRVRVVLFAVAVVIIGVVSPTFAGKAVAGAVRQRGF